MSEPQPAVYDMRAEEELVAIAGAFPESHLPRLAAIPEDWFAGEHTRLARAAMISLLHRGVEVCAPSISREILRMAGDDANMAEAAHRAFATPALRRHWPFWQRILLETAKRRRVRECASGLMDGDTIEDMDALHAQLETLSAMTAPADQAPITEIRDVLGAVVDDMQAACAAVESGGSNLRGIPTGLKALDTLTGGWLPGQLILIGARPSVGKTALLCSVAYEASRRGYRVLYLSVEMSMEELTRRFLSIHTGVSYSSMMQGTVSRHNQITIASRIEDVSALPISLAERMHATVGSIRMELERAFRAEDEAQIPRVVVLDYLQLVSALTLDGKRQRDRREQVDEISRSLKMWSREFHVPIVCAAQLKREAQDKTPSLSDFRESGALEQDADIALLIHRPHLGEHGTDYEEAQILLSKHRNGPTGTIHATYHRPTMRWADASQQGGEW